jgi:bifunctional enzyme CysN/CysC
VQIQPSGAISTIKRIVSPEGGKRAARAGDAACIELADDLDVGRGEILSEHGKPLEVADQFSARVVWLNQPNLVPGRRYAFRTGTAEGTATVTRLASRLDLDSLTERPAEQLGPNDIGRVKLSLDKPVPFAPYAESRDLGGFLLIDPISGNTLGAGMIEYALRRTHTVHWHEFTLDCNAYAAQKGQKPCLLWFTGLSASGKSTLADLLGRALYARGRHIYILDGDNLRYGLNRDLGFTERDRVENVRRAGEIARLMVDAGLIVLATFISPYREDRRAVRARFSPGRFFEIFVDTPLDICARRDPKGLYKKARAGEISNFTGISAPFEAPEAPEVHLQGEKPAEELLEDLLRFWETNISADYGSGSD